MVGFRSTVRQVPVDLLGAVGLTLALNAAVFLPGLRDTLLRVPLGFVFVCLVPGYVVIAALFPERFYPEGEKQLGSQSSTRGTQGADGITLTERLLLSAGVSLVVVPAIAYAWNFTQTGIQLAPVLLSVSGFTVGVAVFAALRRWRLPNREQFQPTLSDWVDVLRSISVGGRSSRLITAILVVSALFFAASVGYAAVDLSHDEQYSEFYLLSGDGETFAGADETPEVVAGEQQTVGVAVGNHEGGSTDYTVVVVQQTVDDSGETIAVQNQTRLDSFSVAADANETAVRNYTFTATERADRSRVVWLLYPNEAPDTASTMSASNHVYLWVTSNATETESSSLG